MVGGQNRSPPYGKESATIPATSWHHRFAETIVSRGGDARRGRSNGTRKVRFVPGRSWLARSSAAQSANEDVRRTLQCSPRTISWSPDSQGIDCIEGQTQCRNGHRNPPVVFIARPFGLRSNCDDRPGPVLKKVIAALRACDLPSGSLRRRRCGAEIVPGRVGLRGQGDAQPGQRSDRDH